MTPEPPSSAGSWEAPGQSRGRDLPFQSEPLPSLWGPLLTVRAGRGLASGHVCPLSPIFRAGQCLDVTSTRQAGGTVVPAYGGTLALAPSSVPGSSPLSPPRPAAPCPSARRGAHIGPLTLSLAVTHAHAKGRRAVSPHTAAAQGLGLFRGVEIAGSPLHKESDPVLLPHSGVTQLNQICHRVPKRAKCPSRSVSECGRGSVRVCAHVPVCARVCTCVRADARPGPALRRAADWLRVSF